MFVFFIIVAIAILLLMVVIHEYGHYCAGKLLGFKILEFSVGFGPKILQRTLKNGEKFTLRMIPLGGYCAFFDEEGTGDGSQNGVKSFVQHSPLHRMIVFVSGALFNFVSAIIFALIFIFVSGYSVPVVNELTPVLENPNQNYATELKLNDIIVGVNDRELGVMYTWNDAMNTVKGDNVDFYLTVVRDGNYEKITVRRQEISVLDEQNNVQTYQGFGFVPVYQKQSVNFFDAVANCVPLTLKFSWMILGAFGSMLTGQVPLTQMTGPISTVTSIASFAQANAQVLLMLLPLIASNLAIFNLLPIPALDGSKIVFVVIEWIRGKPVKREIEGLIHFVGFVALLGAVLLLEVLRVFVK